MNTDSSLFFCKYDGEAIRAILEKIEQLNETVNEQGRTIKNLSGPRMAVFDTPGEYEFTVPDGVYTIFVSACGGGGSGGYTSGTQNYTAGGGGGAAAIYKQAYKVTPGEVITITVGEGGKNTGSAKGDAGEATIITMPVNVTLPGGGGGRYGSGGSAYGGISGGPGGGDGGRGNGGAGSCGILGYAGPVTIAGSGSGGGSLGHGGTAGSPGYRGGGGGGNSDGGDGYVEITW